MITFFPQFKGRIDCRMLTKKEKRILPTSSVRLHQVHGNRTIIAKEAMSATEEADGVVTPEKGLCLSVRAADCQNFAVYAPEKHVAGVLHAGWRGVVGGAIPGFFSALEQEYGIEPHEVYVVAGPSMCLECAEYSDPEHELRQKINKRFVHGNQVDLQGAATMQLLELGVPRDHFFRHEDCTTCSPKTYITYRGGDREQVEQGDSNVLLCTLL